MDVKNRNLVTAPGDSDSQVPASVSGPGVKAGSNVAGSLRSSSHDREGAGVASQAPATLTTTSAEDLDRNRKPGNDDYEAMTTETPEVLWEQDYPISYVSIETIREYEDEQVALNVLEMHDNMSNDIAKLARLANEMYAFSNATRNLHKKMKEWCVELKMRSDRVVKSSKCALPFVEATSERVTNLSHSILEMSTSTAIQKDTVEKKVGTDAPFPPERSNKNRPATKTIRQERGAPRSQPEQEGQTPERRKKKAKMKRTKPVSVVFNKEGLTYADMLKKIRQDTSIQNEGHKIDAVSKTASGQLRIVLNRNADNPDHLAKAISQAIGNGTTTRTFGDSSQIEIQDIDEEATEEEILQAVTTSTGVPGSAKLLRVRKLARRGTKCAVVAVSSSIAAKLSAKRLRIGYVSCRVSRLTEVRKCYKCQNFGHTRSSCEGPERSNQCWRCGKEGHRSKDCVNPPKCALCSSVGDDEDHVMGSYRCNSYRRALEAEKKKTKNN